MYQHGLAEINRELLTGWLPDGEEAVPSVILDCVVTVPVGEDGPGIMRQEGPAQATEGHVLVQQEETVFAMESLVQDFNERQSDLSSKVVLLLEKLDELEAAGSRSVSVEIASRISEDSNLVDHIGRERVLQLCDEIKQTCAKLSAREARTHLEEQLRDAVLGKSRWLLPETSAEEMAPSTDEAGSAAKHLLVETIPKTQRNHSDETQHPTETHRCCLSAVLHLLEEQLWSQRPRPMPSTSHGSCWPQQKRIRPPEPKIVCQRILAERRLLGSKSLTAVCRNRNFTRKHVVSNTTAVQ